MEYFVKNVRHIFFRISILSCYKSDVLFIKTKKTRAARDGLCSPKRSLLGSEGHWEMGGDRRGGWGETDYLCLVPSAKLHLPLLSWTSFQEMLQPE